MSPAAIKLPARRTVRRADSCACLTACSAVATRSAANNRRLRAAAVASICWCTNCARRCLLAADACASLTRCSRSRCRLLSVSCSTRGQQYRTRTKRTTRNTHNTHTHNTHNTEHESLNRLRAHREIQSSTTLFLPLELRSPHLGSYPIVTLQDSSTASYQVSNHTQQLFSQSDNRMYPYPHLSFPRNFQPPALGAHTFLSTLSRCTDCLRAQIASP